MCIFLDEVWAQNLYQKLMDNKYSWRNLLWKHFAEVKQNPIAELGVLILFSWHFQGIKLIILIKRLFLADLFWQGLLVELSFCFIEVSDREKEC